MTQPQPPNPSPENRTLTDLESVLKKISNTVLRYKAAREKRSFVEVDVLESVRDLLNEVIGKGHG